MTKSDLNNAVHGNSGSDSSKKLVGKIIDSAFENVGKAIRKDKRVFYFHSKERSIP